MIFQISPYWSRISIRLLLWQRVFQNSARGPTTIGVISLTTWIRKVVNLHNILLSFIYSTTTSYPPGVDLWNISGLICLIPADSLVFVGASKHIVTAQGIPSGHWRCPFRHTVRLAAFRLIEAGLELKPSIESRCHPRNWCLNDRESRSSSCTPLTHRQQDREHPLRYVHDNHFPCMKIRGGQSKCRN